VQPSDHGGFLNGAQIHSEHKTPASFHRSPQDARQAPPEEFLYLACPQEGTGVEPGDFLAVFDAEEGRIVHETAMPNVCDELHHEGRPRAKRSDADGEPHAGADRHEHRLDGRFVVDEPGHVDDFAGV
jgi:56kDa selenium binding protein (SBP56)